jgi:hypothetical protein
MKPTVGELAIRAAGAFALVVLITIVLFKVFPAKEEPLFLLSDNAEHASFDGTLPQDPLTLYQSEWNIYAAMFKEPFETAMFLFSDGSVMTFSTHEVNRVGVATQTIIEWIKKMGKNIGDCVVVAHNHFTPAGFTDSDRYTYNYLKSAGFKGVFGIYYTATGIFQAIE